MSMSATTASNPGNGRWWQLAFGVICMMLIANLQYGWTLFVKPIQAAHHWEVGDIQLAFSIFIALETWLTPAGGALVDLFGARRGPKYTIALGGLMVGIGWVVNSYAGSLTLLYIGSAVTGIGAGFIYATCVGIAVRWFPDRRGLAVGLTAAGFGAGAAITVLPIKAMIEGSGYAHTFLVFGIGQGVLLFIVAWLLRMPEPGEVPSAPSKKIQQSSRSFTPREVLGTPVFWLLYAMFVMVSSSGLMATAQLALIAADFGIDKTLLLGGASVLAVALVVDNIANGGARPFFGWVSDQIGRENTMIIAFTLGGVSYLLLGSVGHQPWLFVLFAALIFFTWGEIFSLFPSTCTDAFGPKYATINTALLYTAKGTSALLVPFANMIKTATGSWYTVFLVAAIMNFGVVLLALFVLKPLRRAQDARSDRMLTSAIEAAPAAAIMEATATPQMRPLR
jgi:OFA family oxalate/formate antiporter-like MFS transporter